MGIPLADATWLHGAVAALIVLALLSPVRRVRRRRRAAGMLSRWLWARRIARPSANARAGRAGERKVARALARAGFPVLNDVYLPIGDDTTQVDHVVLAGGVIVVLETKHMAGLVRGRLSEPQWTQAIPGRRRAFRNPVVQNQLHEEAVRIASGGAAPVAGVVVFSASARLVVTPEDAVVRLADLIPFLARVAERSPANARSQRAWRRLDAEARRMPLAVARRRHAATLARSRSR